MTRKANDDSWSWRVFWNGFWSGFGKMMAFFAVGFVILPFIGDTSSASFESAVRGIAFALFISCIYGASDGDAAVREWRYQKS